MKRMAVVFLFVSALFLAGTAQSLAAQAGNGLLRIKHSPTTGMNVTFAVYIDGAKVGVFSRGHVYEHSLSPGRHNLVVTRTGRGDSWRGTLEVQAGQTYSFVAKVTPDEVHLVPVTHFG